MCIRTVYGLDARHVYVELMQLKSLEIATGDLKKKKNGKFTVTLENAGAHVTRIWHILFVIGNMDLHFLACGCSHSTNWALMVLNLIMPHHMDFEFVFGNKALRAYFAAERIHFDGSMCVHMFLHSNRLESKSDNMAESKSRIHK